MTVHPDEPVPHEEDSFDLRQLVDRLWAGRWWIVACTLVLTAAFTTAAFVMVPIYRATLVMIPASTEVNGMGGALNSALNQFGGLAALAGINLGTDDSITEEALAVVHSREFTQRFIQDNDLLPKLYPRKWNAAAGKWDVAPDDVPTLSDAVRMFDRDILAIARDRKTGLVTLRIDWRNQDEAASWANEMVRRLNAEMRARAIQRSDASIAYLEKELQSTTLVGMREAIPRLMEAQIKQRMLANVMPEYAFRVVDKAMRPDRYDKVRPKKSMLIAAGFLAGLVLGAMIVLVRASFAGRRKAA